MGSRCRRIIGSPVAWGIGAGVLIVAGLLAWLVFPSLMRDRVTDTDESVVEGDEEGEFLGVGVRRRSVELVYPNGEGGWTREERTIQLPPDDARRLRVVLDAWVQGSERGQTLFPRRTRVLSAFVDGDGRAYVDLSEDAVRGFAPGSASEVEAISGIARTIEANLPRVVELQLLVDGSPVVSLGGHIAVDMPLSVAYFADLP